MGKQTILLADDNKQVRDVLALTLAGDSVAIVEAETGRRALELTTAELPDLVLLDISMPDMNGIEVCRAIKSDLRTSAIKVIMLTASSSPVDRAMALKAGADDYLVKPFSPLSLLKKVQGTLK